VACSGHQTIQGLADDDSKGQWQLQLGCTTAGTIAAAGMHNKLQTLQPANPQVLVGDLVLDHTENRLV
jgi:hypothetical protein